MITSLWDNLRLSVSELFTNKLRAFLTVLGITIGIAAVVLLLSLGQSVQAYITSQFEGLGATTIRCGLTTVLCGDRAALGEKWPELVESVRAALRQYGPIVADDRPFHGGFGGGHRYRRRRGPLRLAARHQRDGKG